MITVKQDIKEAQDMVVKDIIVMPHKLGLIDGSGGAFVVAEVRHKGDKVELYGYHLGDLYLVEFDKDYKLPMLPEMV